VGLGVDNLVGGLQAILALEIMLLGFDVMLRGAISTNVDGTLPEDIVLVI
jgi:hypothetical protein